MPLKDEIGKSLRQIGVVRHGDYKRVADYHGTSRQYVRKIAESLGLKIKPRTVDEKRAYDREYRRAYARRPEVQERARIYRRGYAKRPERREKLNAYQRESSRRPDVRAKRAAYMKGYLKTYRERPGVREKIREKNREAYRKRKERRAIP